jgi:hypothetical protein
VPGFIGALFTDAFRSGGGSRFQVAKSTGAQEVVDVDKQTVDTGSS